MPINLREFLTQRFGSSLNSNSGTILDFAAHADEATLSKVARAIRRYSTSRARQAWAECSAPTADFERAAAAGSPRAILCLNCQRLEFGADRTEVHRDPGCLTVDFTPACVANPPAGEVMPVADSLQRQIEDFRAVRAAFGLSHFDLDCYVTNRRVRFSWRPISAGV